MWLCGYLTISSIQGEQGQLLSSPQARESFDFLWVVHRLPQVANPFTASTPVGLEGPLAATALVNPSPARGCCLLLATRGHCPASPTPALLIEGHSLAFTSGIGLTPRAGPASWALLLVHQTVKSLSPWGILSACMASTCCFHLPGSFPRGSSGGI